MTKLAYFDCFSGVSGDMVLGALVDAGADLAGIEAEVRKLGLKNWSIASQKVRRGALAATQVIVGNTEDHHHRGLSKILDRIAAANLAPRVTDRASRIFRRLAESEARIHGLTVDEVHFHEVGAVDAIVDVAGACAGFEQLGIERFACSALNVGSGRVNTAHGILPVPAPATADLLRGIPTYAAGPEKELTTPTGAAIVSTLCEHFGALPPMRVAAVGYGAGSNDFPGQPNVLRLLVGESLEAQTGAGWNETVTVIEANLDDMNPQIYGYFADRALAGGALDVFAVPVQMKKGRPGQLLTVLCRPQDASRMAELLFEETTTIGVRSYEARRQILERETVPVETPHGTVRVKVSRRNGAVLNAAPEYEDCRRLAAERGVPLKQVLADAVVAFEGRRKA